MAPMVPYRSNGSARGMMARAMSTVGTRRAGRMALVPTRALNGLGCGCGLGGAGGRAPAPGPGLNAAYVPYEAAKRMGLGSLGLTGSGPPVGAGAGPGAEIGATQGASYGSVAGPIGAAVGAVIGAIGGAIAGSINKKDPEQYNFDSAVALWQQNPNNVYNIGNKYLPLAGLFDLSLKGPHIPIYQKYGRMGEQKFVTDLVNQIYSAAQQGRIGLTDTAFTIMSRIVQPWIDSWGFGPMVDPHSDLINRLIVGMIAEYVAGQEHNWTARGGDYPFSALPPFKLPQSMLTPPPVAAPAPVAVTPLPIAAPSPVLQLPLPAPPAALPIVSVPAPVTLPAIMPLRCTAPLVWNGTQCVQPTVPPPAATAPAPTPPPAAAVPSGFTVVGNDSTGNPIFASPQGVLYSWNGSTMAQFTGTLPSNASQASQMQAAIQQALAQGYSSGQAAQMALAQQQAAGATVPPAIQAQAATQAATTAAAPTTAAAGVAPGGMIGIAAVGATVLALIFATARPAGKPRRARA